MPSQLLVSKEQSWAQAVMERLLNNDGSNNNGSYFLSGFYVPVASISFKHVYMITYYVTCASLNPLYLASH